MYIIIQSAQLEGRFYDLSPSYLFTYDFFSVPATNIPSHSGPSDQVVKDLVTGSNGIESTYSVITDVHTTYVNQSQLFGSSSVEMRESSLPVSRDVDCTYLECGTTTQTRYAYQLRPTKYQTCQSQCYIFFLITSRKIYS